MATTNRWRFFWVFSIALLAVTSTVVLALGNAGALPYASQSPALPSALAPAATFPTPVQHVVVIMMENANASWVLQNGSYQRYLANQYAYASQTYSPKHGSNGDYFAITSGNTWTALKEYSTSNLADLTAAAGLSWMSFEESMPKPCDAISPSHTAPYNSGHNPFAWYQDVRNPASYCDSHDVGFGPLSTDLAAGTMPSYALIVPNQTHDAHNLCSGAAWETLVSCGDAWLRGFLSPILNSSASWVRSTAFLITYDEANLSDTRGYMNTTGGGIVYTAAVGPCATPHYTSAAPYSLFSLLTTTEWLLGLGHTGHHDSWTTYPPLKAFFNNPSCGGSGATYTLSTAATPAAGGSVLPPSGTYPAGSSVTLSESPASGYGFAGWRGTGIGSYTGSTSSPTVTMNSNLTEVALFAPWYPVSFRETGLPPGTTWSVTLGGVAGSSSSTSITFSLANGNYTFTVGPVSGYTVLPESGTVGVAGSAVSVGVTFTPGAPVVSSFIAVPASVSVGGTAVLEVTASGGSGGLQYAYSGLPPGCLSANTASLPCTPSAGGTYSIGVTVTDSLGRSASATTTLTVGSGASLTFAETGLPVGTEWSVTVGGSLASSSTATLTFYLPAAKYSWVVGPVPDMSPKKPAGYVSLSASGTTVPVTFVHAYLVTFQETGLAAGTAWSVGLRGVTESSTLSTLTFWTPNGTYAYALGAVPGYTASGSPTSVVVAHAPMTVAVTFAAISGAVPIDHPGDVTLGLTTPAVPGRLFELDGSIFVRST